MTTTHSPSSPKFPDVKVKLTGTDGNIFALMARVTTALRRAGHGDAVADLQEEVTNSESYSLALGVLMSYVEVS